MATVTLLATAYSTTNVATVTNPSNAYTDTTSTTYASVTTTSNSASKAYFYGFDFSQIPSNAENISFTCKIKVSLGVGSTGSAYNVCLANRSTGDALSATTATTTTATVVTLTPTSATWSDIVALGNNFAFCVNHQRTNRTHYVYGMEIDVTYTMPEPKPNKVIYNGRTLIDLTNDDILPEDVTAGKTFHLPNGEQATGTGGGGIEYETGTWSPSSNTTTAPTISFNGTHTKAPAVISLVNVSTSSRSENDLVKWFYIDYTEAIPDYNAPSSSSIGGTYSGSYGYTYAGGSGYGEVPVSYTISDIPWTYVTTTSFVPNCSAKYFRSNKVYNWIAIWV